MNDQAGALRAEVRQRGAGEAEGAHEIHVHLVQDLLLGEALGESDGHQAGIADRDIEAASLAYDLVDGLLHESV